MFLLASVHANEFKTIFDSNMRQVDRLPELTQDYFAGAKGVGFNDGLTLQDITDYERSRLRIALHNALSIAIDTGRSIEALAAYGIQKQKDGVYVIEYSKTPQWAEVSGIFGYLSEPQFFDNARTRLRQMGLSQQDLNLVASYIKENHIHIKNDRTVLKQLSIVEKQMKQSKTKNAMTALAAKFGDIVWFEVESNWHQWINTLLKQLPRTKQLALLQYGKDQLGTAMISSTGYDEQTFSYMAKRIQSGQYRSQVINRINYYQKRLDDWEAVK